jgi:hypothetical protein
MWQYKGETLKNETRIEEDVTQKEEQWKKLRRRSCGKIPLDEGACLPDDPRNVEVFYEEGEEKVTIQCVFLLACLEGSHKC